MDYEKVYFLEEEKTKGIPKFLGVSKIQKE
jgi:hypothetical protein